MSTQSAAATETVAITTVNTMATAAITTVSTMTTESLVGGDRVEKLEAMHSWPSTAGPSKPTRTKEGLEGHLLLPVQNEGTYCTKFPWESASEKLDTLGCKSRPYESRKVSAHTYTYIVTSAFVSPISRNQRYHLKGTINVIPISFLLDTGAAVTSPGYLGQRCQPAARRNSTGGLSWN